MFEKLTEDRSKMAVKKELLEAGKYLSNSRLLKPAPPLPFGRSGVLDSTADLGHLWQFFLKLRAKAGEREWSLLIFTVDKEIVYFFISKLLCAS